MDKEGAGNTNTHEGGDDKDDGEDDDDNDDNSYLKHWFLAGRPKNENKNFDWLQNVTIIYRNCYLSKPGYFAIW